jgi:hypothetical protein
MWLATAPPLLTNTRRAELVRYKITRAEIIVVSSPHAFSVGAQTARLSIKVITLRARGRSLCASGSEFLFSIHAIAPKKSTAGRRVSFYFAHGGNAISASFILSPHLIKSTLPRVFLSQFISSRHLCCIRFKLVGILTEIEH